MRIGWAAGRGHLPLGLVGDGTVVEPILHQKAAAHAFVIERRLGARPRQLHDPEILLLLEHRQRVRIDARRDDDLDEQLAHRLGGRAIDDGVERDHRPERRRAIGRERTVEGVRGVATQRDSAWRRVLDDHARDPCVLAPPGLPRRHGHHCRVDVQEIIERQLLAVELLQVANARLVGHVERGPLVRVFAVAQRLLPLEHETHGWRQRLLRS